MRLQIAITLFVGMLSGAALLGVRSVAQPSLDPPAGPVERSQRFGLGTVINATNTPGVGDALFTITEPGLYYLADNITITDFTTFEGKLFAIEIASDDVTLDLNGFTIARQRLTNPLGSDSEDTQRGSNLPPEQSIAITTLDNGASGLHISNGNIRGFATGVRSTPVVFGGQTGTDSVLERMDIESSHPNRDGMNLGTGWTVRDCHVRSAGTGIRATASGFGANNIRVIDCTVISVGTGINSDNALIQGCVVTSQQSGIIASDAVIRSCVVVAGETGIFANRSVIESCRARTSSDFAPRAAIEADDCVIANCFASAPSSNPAFDISGLSVISNSTGNLNSNVEFGVEVLNCRL